MSHTGPDDSGSFWGVGGWEADGGVENGCGNEWMEQSKMLDLRELRLQRGLVMFLCLSRFIAMYFYLDVDVFVFPSVTMQLFNPCKQDVSVFRGLISKRNILLLVY